MATHHDPFLPILEPAKLGMRSVLDTACGFLLLVLASGLLCRLLVKLLVVSLPKPWQHLLVNTAMIGAMFVAGGLAPRVLHGGLNLLR